MTEIERKQKSANYSKKWRETHPIENRASQLLSAYNREDKKYGRGKGDLTMRYIINNIFSKPCAHCGKEGWDVIGCNRINNSKPHTKDNVEPCCLECNVRLGNQEKMSLVDKIDRLTGEVLNSYTSINEAAKSVGGYDGNISYCCNGGYFDKKRNKWVNISQFYGFVWKRLV